MMKFGAVLPSYGPTAGRLAILDAALAAENLGYDSVWVTDHIAVPENTGERFGNIFESITTLAYLAAATRRVRLGISALILPQRNPIEVAKQMATVDVLSGGRTILATGAGWIRGEFESLGYAFDNRGKRFDEGLKVLRALWRGSRVVSFQGQYTSFEKVIFSPGPVQAGGPELWVGGNSAVALRRAVMLADGWHPDSIDAGDLAALLAKARPMLLNRPFAVAPRMRLDFTAAPEDTFLGGSPQQVVDKLRDLKNAGITYGVISFSTTQPANLEKTMQLFAREVIPALQQE